MRAHAGPAPRRGCAGEGLPECAKVESGRLLGLVSGAVFKTVERLLEPLVCSIRTAFRQESFGCQLSALVLRARKSA